MCRKINMLYPFLVLSLVVFLNENTVQAEQICQGVDSQATVSPGFTESEKLLLCGKPSLQQTPFQAWSDVPSSQAALHLRGILQSRGYLRPQIQIQNDNLSFDPGPIVRVSEVLTRGAPDGFDIKRRRGVLNEPLTPSLLSNLESWSRSELQRSGYPCPRAQAAAQAENGKILVQIDPGPKKSFGPIVANDIPNFDTENLKRYRAFTSDQEFDRTLLQVSEDRSITEGLVEQTQFELNCMDQEAPIQQLSVLGEPRLLTFSFSTNTEVIAQGEVSFRKTRLDSMASYFDVSATASARLLQATAYYRKYFESPGSSAAFRPLLSYRHQDEKPFALDTQQAQLFYLNHWDLRQGFGVSIGFGPELQLYDLHRGPLEGETSRSFSLQSEFELQSYEHEIYRENIYQGYRAKLTAGTQGEQAGSDFSAQNWKLETEVLENLTHDSPSNLMGAWRLNAATTSAPNPEKLPPTYRQYLGGSHTLRGFNRFQLPATNQGALTQLSSSFELRTSHWSETIWPLVFLDVGWLGRDSFQLNSTLYQSPGVGLYWQSPIGPFRMTIAHGEADTDLNDSGMSYHQWQFFASLGDRF